MSRFFKFDRVSPGDLPTPQSGKLHFFLDPNDGKLYVMDENRSVFPMEGAQGPQGNQGDPGPSGSNGNDGSQGPQGEQGPQGDPGGPQGPQGNDGAQGPQGNPGNDGVIQYSFNNSSVEDYGGYHNIALVNDNYSPGSSMCYGTDGSGNKGWVGLGTGPQGPAGNDGAPGSNGNDGAQGPPGNDGATGPAGFSIFGSPGVNDTGSEGETRWDSEFLYICISANTWRRIAHYSY